MKFKLKNFSATPLSKALRGCIDKGYDALFAPEIIRLRTKYFNNKQIDKELKEKKLWERSFIPTELCLGSFTSLSLIVSGKTEGGNDVVIYTHAPHYFCDPKNIENVHKFGRGGIFPLSEFKKLLDQDGLKDDKKNRLVWVMDYEFAKDSKKSLVCVCGGKDIAEEYSAKYKQRNYEQLNIQEPEKISEQPQAGFLFIGYNNELEHVLKLPNIHIYHSFLGYPTEERHGGGVHSSDIYISYCQDKNHVPYGAGSFLGKRKLEPEECVDFEQ